MKYSVKIKDSFEDDRHFDTAVEADDFARANTPSLLYNGDEPLWGYYTPDDKEDPVRIHAYPIEKILAPGGSFEVGSLSKELLTVVRVLQDIWTNPLYSDSVDLPHFIKQLRTNAHSEIDLVIDRLMTGE